MREGSRLLRASGDGVSAQAPQLVDASAMAELLSISRDALYELALAGELEGAYRVGNRWRFDVDKVLASLEVKNGAGERRVAPVVSLDRRRKHG